MLTRRLATACAVAAVLLAASASSHADQALNLFSGTTDFVNLGPWGSGEIKISNWERFRDRQTLEVLARGYHEGGRLDLKTPVDFGPFVGDPIQTQVVMLVKAGQPERPRQPRGYYGPQMGPGMMPGMEMPPGGMPPGGYPPGMMDEMMMGMPGMGGTAGMRGQPQASQALPVDKVRVVLVTDKGHLSSGDLALNPNLLFDDDWLLISVVLSDFGMPEEDLAGAKLERVVLTGNGNGYIHVASLQIIQEDTPLVAEIEGPEVRTIPAGQPAEFTAKPQHEGVAASYQWDFDNLDGLGIDGYSEKVSCQFPEPGYYVATLRVVDEQGRLQTRMDTIKVKVQ